MSTLVCRTYSGFVDRALGPLNLLVSFRSRMPKVKAIDCWTGLRGPCGDMGNNGPFSNVLDP